MDEIGKGSLFMNKVADCITKLFDMVYRILSEYSKAVLIVIVCVVSAQVFCRKFLGFSIRWSEEVALLLMVWMAFVSMAIGVEKHLHIAISMFFDKMPPKVQFVISKVTDALMILFGVVMIYFGVKLVQSTMSSTLPATKWPSGTLYVMIPVSGIFIAYYSFIDLFGLERYKHENIIGNHN